MALAAASAASAASPAEPTGYGPLRFGMSIEEARSMLPSLAPLAATPVVPANTPIAFMQVTGERYEGLGPCTIILGFLSDHFYEARFDCAPRDAKVDAALRKRYGAPTSTQGPLQIWQTDHTTLALNTSVHTFSLADRGLTQALNQIILQKALAGHQAMPGGAPAAGK